MAKGNASDNPLWWREAVFYEIYPLSFADSDGDGFGDLQGVISKLDYLKDTLGVDALWLTPFFKSPMKDWGYDVSDYRDVDPVMGTLDDARRLIDEVHDREMRVIFDFVINHTSDAHPWFRESRSSRDNPKRDWYVWEDGRDGGPPNNWISLFAGPAWTHDAATDQWYRHTFLSSQPDLNWRNPEVVEAMLDIVRFWLDAGVDGFRVDAAHQILKDPDNRDNPPAPPDTHRPWKDMGEYDEFIHVYDYGHPDVHEIHRKLRAVLDSYPHHPMSVGEMHIFDLPEWASYYGDDFDQLHMPFNFHLMATEWTVPRIRATVESVLWNVPAGGWTNWTLGNHDEARLTSRLPEGHDRLAAMLILTLRGTPFIYYGDELGMPNTEVTGADVKDPWGATHEHLLRDVSRTPMQWSPGPNAGFTTADTEPWLPLGTGFAQLNVETELADPDSMLNLYRRLLALRKKSPALRIGSFLTHPSSTDETLVYRREADSETLTVAINFGDRATSVSIRSGKVVLSSADSGREDSFRETLTLGPLEGVIVSH